MIQIMILNRAEILSHMMNLKSTRMKIWRKCENK
jgi:hypothetical protein